VSVVYLQDEDTRAFEMIDASSNCHIFSVESEFEATFWLNALKAASDDALNGLIGSEREKVQQELLTKSLKSLYFKLPTEEDRKMDEHARSRRQSAGDAESRPMFTKTRSQSVTNRPVSNPFLKLQGSTSTSTHRESEYGGKRNPFLSARANERSDIPAALANPFRSTTSERDRSEEIVATSAQKDDTIRLSQAQEQKTGFLDLHDEIQRDLVRKGGSMVCGAHARLPSGLLAQNKTLRNCENIEKDIVRDEAAVAESKMTSQITHIVRLLLVGGVNSLSLSLSPHSSSWSE
jgi:hypothetical protein